MDSDYQILLLDFRKEFIDVFSKNNNYSFISSARKGKYSIVAIDESGCALDDIDISAECVLCPHSTPCRGIIKCNTIISCGMSLKSTFCLSSTDENTSMFSVSRAVPFSNNIILPYEEKFLLDRRLTLYENIVLHGINNLLKPTEFCKNCIMKNKIFNNNCYY
jgi:hypothetical protein